MESRLVGVAMSKESKKAESPSGRSVILQWLAIAICLALMAVNATHTQAPGITTSPGDDIYSIVSIFIPALLGVTAFIFAMTRRFSYRVSGIEIGFLIFTAGAIISAVLAANKRAAINEVVIMAGPMVMAMMLVQLLNSPARVKAVLYLIAALGVVNAVECIDQTVSSNDMIIKQYQENPDFVLSRLNIERNSYQQMLFENRLYSKDVRGFFTTGNSSGSFFILALAACAALVIEKRQQMKLGAGNTGEIAGRVIVGAVIVAGIVLTHSKGAIGALLIAALAYAVWSFKREWLAKNKIAVTVVLAALMLLLGGGVVWYGLNHGRLPGGNSMLVRWQYWSATAKMIVAHPLAGVGGGNFDSYYQYYKLPAALETVKDPHNFVLSVLSQYGVAGLIGFIAAVLGPILIAVFGKSSEEVVENNGFKKLIPIILAVVCLVMASIRPIFSQVEQTSDSSVMVYVLFWLFALPIMILIGSMWLLSLSDKMSISLRTSQVVLMLGVAGVLIHNLVDFAIFEPGVYTTMWLLLAVIVSMQKNAPGQKVLQLTPGNLWGSIGVIVGFAIFWASSHFCIGPVVRSGMLMSGAMRTISMPLAVAESPSNFDPNTISKIVRRGFAAADVNMSQAALEDKFDAEIPATQGSIALRVYDIPDENDVRLLQWAKNRFLLAAERDRADFKNYHKLSEVFLKLAEAVPQFKTKYLSQALVAIEEAITRYPGSDMLHFEAGRIANLNGNDALAVEHFKQAVDIENQYRQMFKLMYPSKPLYSRLGEAKYQFALQFINK